MLGNVSNERLLSGNLINQNDSVNETEEKTGLKNPYITPVEFDDTLEVSKEAQELLQKEQDVQRFKDMVLESQLSREELSAIMDLISEGDFIDNKELAEAMQIDTGLMQQLFG